MVLVDVIVLDVHVAGHLAEIGRAHV